LINRSPSITLNKKTPIEVWSGTPVDYSQLKVFTCTAYTHVDNGKIEPRSIKCIFLGYGSGVKGHKFWNPETRKTFMSRSVVFNESVMFYDSLTSDHIPDNFDKEWSISACRWSMWMMIKVCRYNNMCRCSNMCMMIQVCRWSRLWMTRKIKLLIMRLMMMFNTHPLFCS
jgi:hypothetical protein